MLSTIAGERIHSQYTPLFNESRNRPKESNEPDFIQNKEISALTDKFKNIGIFTDEASKILAETIVKGTIDILA
jgi:hypothetical protein